MLYASYYEIKSNTRRLKTGFPTAKATTAKALQAPLPSTTAKALHCLKPIETTLAPQPRVVP